MLSLERASFQSSADMGNLRGGAGAEDGAGSGVVVARAEVVDFGLLHSLSI